MTRIGIGPDQDARSGTRRPTVGRQMRILPFRSSATVSVDVTAVLNNRLLTVRYIERATGTTYDVVAEAPPGAEPRQWFDRHSFQQKMRWLDEYLAASRRAAVR